MKSNYYIEFYDYSFGCGATSRVYLPQPKCEIDMVKALKKYYNRLVKKLERADVTIAAQRETENGIEDLTMQWGYEYMQHDPELPFC